MMTSSLEFTDLEFIERVGRGRSGQVWRGKWKPKNITVAIKVLDGVCYRGLSVELFFNAE